MSASAPFEPEPVECPDCWGDGAVHIYNGRDSLRVPCDRCLGDGAVEP